MTHVGDPTRRTMHKTGTYIGDGNDNRNIDIGVDLASKEFPYVIIKSVEGNSAAHRIEYGQGDLTMHYDNTNDGADLIQQFTATGFQVGASIQVNDNTVVYRYIAFWIEP